MTNWGAVVFFRMHCVRIAEWGRRNERAALRTCIWTVAISFALCSLLQLYFGQSRAYREYLYAQQNRADSIATTVDATLSRLQATGLLFANGGLAEEAVVALPGLRGIAVSDTAGQILRRSGDTIDMVALTALVRGTRTVVGAGHSTLIVFHDADRAIAVAFEPSAIAPAALLKNAELISPTGVTLAGGALTGGTHSAQPIAVATTANWPIAVRIVRQRGEAPSVWNGLLPLYLFGIFAPLGVAYYLTRALDVELARRYKIARLIRALRVSHPRGPKLQLRLAACERRAVETIRNQSALFAKVACEMTGPLNAVAGFAETIATGHFGPVSPARYGEYAHYIGLAGKAIHLQLTQIHELSRIQSGGFAPKMKPCDAVEISAAVIGENASRAFLRRIWLEMVPLATLPMIADEAAVKRILRDVIANSLRRTPKGGRIRLHLAASGSDAVLSLEDTGRPYDRIADPLAGAKGKPRHRANTPANLDLVIAAELARTMGGSLSFTQSPGSGCRAILRLALAPGQTTHPAK